MSLMQSAALVSAETVAVPQSMTALQYNVTRTHLRYAQSPDDVFAILDAESIPGLKRALAFHFPSLKASHRIEAIARGFGWRNWAALKKHMEGRLLGGSAKAIDDPAFQKYVTEHGGLDATATPVHLLDIVMGTLLFSSKPTVTEPSVNMAVRLRDGSEHRFRIRIGNHQVVSQMTIDPLMHAQPDHKWRKILDHLANKGVIVPGHLAPWPDHNGCVLVDYRSMTISSCSNMIDLFPVTPDTNIPHCTARISNEGAAARRAYLIQVIGYLWKAISIEGAQAMRILGGAKGKAMRYDIPAGLNMDALIDFIESDVLEKGGPAVDYAGWEPLSTIIVGIPTPMKFRDIVHIRINLRSPLSVIAGRGSNIHAQGLEMRRHLLANGFTLSRDEEAAWDDFLLVGVTPVEWRYRGPVLLESGQSMQQPA